MQPDFCCLCRHSGGLRPLQSAVGWSEAVKYRFQLPDSMAVSLDPDLEQGPAPAGVAAGPGEVQPPVARLLMAISKRSILHRLTATGSARKTVRIGLFRQSGGHPPVQGVCPGISPRLPVF